jgi:hypothetical protein
MAGFQVKTSELHNGSNEVTALHKRCEIVGGDAVSALAGMAVSAGHPGMKSALSQATSQGTTIYVAAAEVYQHISLGLSGSAQSYDSAEQGITQMIQDWFQK